MGAMVESAPTDMNRLAPKMAKAMVPAAKANNPVSAAMPARWAVASCAGRAIAANVSPAIRSAGSARISSPRSEANNQCARCGLDSVSISAAVAGDFDVVEPGVAVDHDRADPGDDE